MTVLVHAPKLKKIPKAQPRVLLGTPWDMSKHPHATLYDHFAGIGGGTTGARRALERLGYKLGETLRIVAVNHDPEAVANHALNHPEAEHHCCPLEQLEPRLAATGHVCDECKDLEITTPCPLTGVKGERATVLVTCAPCQEYSNANQKVYSRKQYRATPDYSRRWRQILRPLVVIEENVWQITTKWDGWKKHLRHYNADGYRHEHRKLDAARYGTPQHRKRMILMAIARDHFGPNQPIPWPKSKHSEGGREPGTRPYIPVLPCLDFDEPAQSFFDGRKTDGEAYAENVRLRLARYLREKSPFYEPLAKAVETFSGRVPLAEALDACPEKDWPTWIARLEDGRVVLTADRFLVHQLPGGECRDVNEPGYSQLTAAYHRLAEVRCVLPLRGPEGGPLANKAYDPAEKPAHCLTTRGGGYYAEGRVIAIVPRRAQRGGRDGEEVYDPAERPSHAVLASHRPGWLAEVAVVPGGGSGAPVRDATEPGNALTHGGAWMTGVEVRMTACEPVLLPHHGEDKERGQLPRFHETTSSAPTMPASRRFDVAFPAIVSYHGSNTDVRAASEASPTIATKNQHYAFWIRVEGQWIGPIFEAYLDLPYRQLTPRETARIQGFDDSLQLTGTITAMQRGIGNAVPPPLIDACLTSVFEMRGIRTPTLLDFDGGCAA